MLSARVFLLFSDDGSTCHVPPAPAATSGGNCGIRAAGCQACGPQKPGAMDVATWHIFPGETTNLASPVLPQDPKPTNQPGCFCMSWCADFVFRDERSRLCWRPRLTACGTISRGRRATRSVRCSVRRRGLGCRWPSGCRTCTRCWQSPRWPTGWFTRMEEAWRWRGRCRLSRTSCCR